MNPSKYSLTFACYNSVEYTKKCIESMVAHGTPLDRLVVVDNQSTDSTRDYLMTLPLGGRIFNPNLAHPKSGDILYPSMPAHPLRERLTKYGKLAGLLTASFFLAKGLLWLLIPGLLIGSCTK
jgi:hypothetical protein